jgi:RHS repeat-associated protein
MIKRANQTITYTLNNKVKRLTINDDKSIDFYYDTNDYRYKKSTNSYDRYYLDKEYEKTEYKNNNEEEKYFIYVNNKVVAIYTKEKQDENINTTTNYLYYDNLDSVDMITNNKGEILQRYIYTPFGKKITLDKDGNIISSSSINRCYTGHEDIEEDDTLVNMNARLYDSTIGRVISADTFIPDPFSTQDFNRYSYVLNNPMKYTDPSGHNYQNVQEKDVQDDWEYRRTLTWIETKYWNNKSQQVSIIRHIQIEYLRPWYRWATDDNDEPYQYVSHKTVAVVKDIQLLTIYSRLKVNENKEFFNNFQNNQPNAPTPFEDSDFANSDYQEPDKVTFGNQRPKTAIGRIAEKAVLGGIAGGITAGIKYKNPVAVGYGFAAGSIGGALKQGYAESGKNIESISKIGVLQVLIKENQ